MYRTVLALMAVILVALCIVVGIGIQRVHQQQQTITSLTKQVGANDTTNLATQVSNLTTQVTNLKNEVASGESTIPNDEGDVSTIQQSVSCLETDMQNLELFATTVNEDLRALASGATIFSTTDPEVGATC